MVEISEVVEEDPQPAAPAAASTSSNNNAADARAEERLSDADEIEAAMGSITRPSARLHLENLITKLRKEGKALQRVAASKAAASVSSDAEMEDESEKPSSVPQAAAQLKDPPVPKRSPATPPVISTNKYQSFPTYYFDAGSYNSPTVSVYVPLDGIGSHDKSKISCDFTSTSFDLIVRDKSLKRTVPITQTGGQRGIILFLTINAAYLLSINSKRVTNTGLEAIYIRALI